MKKLLSFLIASLLPMVGQAHDIEVANADGVTIYYNYINDSTELEVTFQGETYSSFWNEYQGDVVIPEEVTYMDMTRKVTSIGDYAFSACSGLTSVTIPNSVTSIGHYAFNNCTRLPSVTIPNSVTSIGNDAFVRCSGLTSVTIPNSVTSIGNDAFLYCSSLTSVHITDLESWCNISFYDSDSNPLTYAHHLFLNGEEIKDLIIPSNVTSIGNEAFSGCSSLSSVTIPNSVTSIGNGAFSGCSSLSSVTIPNSVTSIGVEAFRGCSGLTSVTIPNSVTSIGGGAFFGCSGLTSVTISNSVASIGYRTFAYCSGLTSVTIGNSVTSIGNEAFSGCSSLSSVTIPNSVTNIGYGAFRGCSGLTSVTIGNSVTRIEDHAFDGCSSLTSVTIPNSVTSIGSSAFYNCSSLTSVTIPNSVTSIGSSAFYNCTRLPSVTIPNSVTRIENHAFNGCKLENIFTKNSKTAFDKSSFSDRTFQHAMLYIPEGTWGYAVYEGDWYLFNNIRETTVDAGKLSASRAYMLMDTNTFGYAVYDDASNEVKMAKAFYSIDEQDLNNCWQVKTQGGQKYLYNLGAKEYASVSADGRLTLSAVPSAVRLTETDNGITLGSDASHQWAFVKNGSQPDVTGIEAPAVSHDEEAVSYYSLGGQQLAQPRKGLVIKKTADGKSRKVMVR